MERKFMKNFGVSYNEFSHQKQLRFGIVPIVYEK